MELTVTVGHCGLQSMAHSRQYCQGPDHPSVVGKEMLSRDTVTEVQFPEHQCEANGRKPKVTTHAVEDAPHAGVLLGEACQLSVGTVKGVGPGDEQHAHPVEPCQIGLLEIEQDATCHAHEDTGHSDSIGADAQFLEQLSPEETEWTVEVEVKPFLGVG